VGWGVMTIGVKVGVGDAMGMLGVTVGVGVSIMSCVTVKLMGTSLL